MAHFASADGTQLHELTWSPAAAPRAQLAIVHGYGEHIARYDHVGSALAERGVQVRGIDWRGHGQSSGVRGFIMRFGEYLEDLDALLARARVAGTPTFLLAHSMGALAAVQYLLDRPDAVDGLILSSPWFRLALPVPAPKIWAGKIASRVLPKLALPSGLKGKDVCRDPEIAAAYDLDPLNNKNATSRWFTEATAAQGLVLANAGKLTVPLLLIQGQEDHIADSKTNGEWFTRVGAADKTLKMLAGQFHEVFNELPPLRAENIATVAAWIDARAQEFQRRAASKVAK